MTFLDDIKNLLNGSNNGGTEPAQPLPQQPGQFLGPLSQEFVTNAIQQSPDIAGQIQQVEQVTGDIFNDQAIIQQQPQAPIVAPIPQLDFSSLSQSAIQPVEFSMDPIVAQAPIGAGTFIGGAANYGQIEPGTLSVEDQQRQAQLSAIDANSGFSFRDTFNLLTADRGEGLGEAKTQYQQEINDLTETKSFSTMSISRVLRNYEDAFNTAQESGFEFDMDSFYNASNIEPLEGKEVELFNKIGEAYQAIRQIQDSSERGQIGREIQAKQEKKEAALLEVAPTYNETLNRLDQISQKRQSEFDQTSGIIGLSNTNLNEEEKLININLSNEQLKKEQNTIDGFIRDVAISIDRIELLGGDATELKSKLEGTLANLDNYNSRQNSYAVEAFRLANQGLSGRALNIEMTKWAKEQGYNGVAEYLVESNDRSFAGGIKSMYDEALSLNLVADTELAYQRKRSGDIGLGGLLTRGAGIAFQEFSQGVSETVSPQWNRLISAARGNNAGQADAGEILLVGKLGEENLASRTSRIALNSIVNSSDEIVSGLVELASPSKITQGAGLITKGASKLANLSRIENAVSSLSRIASSSKSGPVRQAAEAFRLNAGKIANGAVQELLADNLIRLYDPQGNDDFNNAFSLIGLGLGGLVDGWNVVGQNILGRGVSTFDVTRLIDEAVGLKNAEITAEGVEQIRKSLNETYKSIAALSSDPQTAGQIGEILKGQFANAAISKDVFLQNARNSSVFSVYEEALRVGDVDAISSIESRISSLGLDGVDLTRANSIIKQAQSSSRNVADMIKVELRVPGKVSFAGISSNVIIAEDLLQGSQVLNKYSYDPRLKESLSLPGKPFLPENVYTAEELVSLNKKDKRGVFKKSSDNIIEVDGGYSLSEQGQAALGIRKTGELQSAKDAQRSILSGQDLTNSLENNYGIPREQIEASYDNLSAHLQTILC